MQNGIESKITSIKFYNCGYCMNDLKRMYKEIKKHKKVIFRAKVMLIDHKTYGKILVDTGYSHRIYENGLTSKLYHLINPTYYAKKDHILYQLRKDGIKPGDLSMIILTHLHPDHIGGLHDIKNIQIIMSDKCREKITGARYNELVFPNQIGKSIENQIMSVSVNNRSPLKGFKGKDLFGDGSVWLMELEGHAYGQIGIYIPEKKLFYVADAVWGTDFLKYRLRMIPRLIQNDYKAYVQTVKKLTALKGVSIISAHGEEVYNDAQ